MYTGKKMHGSTLQLQWRLRKIQAQTGPEEQLLGMDNLSSQTQPKFKKFIKEECNTIIVYTPQGCIDLCAVTDAGIGKAIENRMREKYDLHFEENFKTCTSEVVPANVRRRLYAKWLSESWREFLSDGGEAQITKAFQMCGMLNAQEGSEDNLIRVPGFPDYCVGEKSVDEFVDDEVHNLLSI